MDDPQSCGFPAAKVIDFVDSRKFRIEADIFNPVFANFAGKSSRMVSVNNMSVEFAATPLFFDISFVINPTDKIALAGKNGAGKSTILKILAGMQSPSSGSVSVPEGITVGYLPQQMRISDDTSVMDEVRKVFASDCDYEKEASRLNEEIAARDDFDSPAYEALLLRLGHVNEMLLLESPGRRDGEIEKTLLGLGFRRYDFSRPTSEFSGGWRMRIELAKILLKNPDLLLLDEPTNHLDIESIQWLEKFLQKKAKAVLLVSHDRAFLDNVTKRTMEISCGKLYDYKASYTKFTELRKERVEQQRKAYDNQQKQIADIREFIERFRYKPSKASQVQSRVKQLEKMILVEVDEVDNSHLSLKFPPASRSGDFPVIAEGLGKTYGSHKVFGGVDMTIRRGEKVAFVGRNGEGKSTMVKCIMGEIPFDGNLRIGHNVNIGYFAQNQAQLLDGELTVFDTIDRVAVGDMRTKIRDLLGAFMFGGEASEKKVKVLSGGERARLAMIKLLLEPCNFLILDEPTNHLDIKTKDILKAALKAFDGTLVLVSHDRDFLDGLAEKVYEFRDGKVKENLGGIYDFLRSRDIDSLSEIERKDSVSVEMQSVSACGSDLRSIVSEGKASYAESKEKAKIIRRARKALEDAERVVGEKEMAIALLEERMSQGEGEPELFSDYDRLKKELEEDMDRWELAQTNLDELLKNNN